MLNGQVGTAEQRRVSPRGVGERLRDFATRGQRFLKQPCDFCDGIIRTADELLAVGDEPVGTEGQGHEPCRNPSCVLSIGAAANAGCVALCRREPNWKSLAEDRLKLHYSSPRMIGASSRPRPGVRGLRSGACDGPPTDLVCHDVPMLGCMDCGFDWERHETQLADDIGRFGPLYRAQTDQIRRAEGEGEEALRTRPAPAVWSPLEYLAHMRDVVEFYLDRIQRILGEDRPQLSAVDFSTLAELRRYNDECVEDTLARLDELASSAASRLRSLEPFQWRRVGVGTDGDERDILVLARRLAHEGHHHLLDITS